MRRAKKMRQHVEKREGICRTKKLVVLGRGDESATRQTLARSARGAAAEAAAVIGASESPRRRSCSNCSCDRRRPSPSGWSTHRSIAGTARRRTRPRAGRAASARRSAVPPSPPGWPRAADHRRLKQTAQRPRRDEEVSIMPTFFRVGVPSPFRVLACMWGFAHSPDNPVLHRIVRLMVLLRSTSRLHPIYGRLDSNPGPRKTQALGDKSLNLSLAGSDPFSVLGFRAPSGC